jgi:transcriptional regulator with XRE-family HTH domain
VLVPKLRQWRERRAMTQEELAEKAGVSVRSVAGYEAGAGARPGTVRKIADTLGVEVEELLDSPKGRLPLEADVPPETPTPKSLTPPLDELLEAAGCKTRWLALPDEEWHKAYSAATPEEERQNAIQIGREVQDEYLAIRPDLIEGMEAERILYPETPWYKCPFGSVWIQTGPR